MLNYHSGVVARHDAGDHARALLREQLHQHRRQRREPRARQAVHPRQHDDVADSSPPAVRIAGGGAATGGWKRGTQTLIDRRVRQRRHPPLRGLCRRPSGRRCAARRLQRRRPRRAMSERGRHRRRSSSPGSPTACTRSPAGRSTPRATPATASQRIAVDNTPPVCRRDAAVVGGRAGGPPTGSTVRWTNPRERFAPIARARYELCPASVDSSDPSVAADARKRCVAGPSRAPADHALIRPRRCPARACGMLRRLWLEDAAGNQNPAPRSRSPVSASTPRRRPASRSSTSDPADPDAAERPRQPTTRQGSPAARSRCAAPASRLWRPLNTRVTAAGPDGDDRRRAAAARRL